MEKKQDDPTDVYYSVSDDLSPLISHGCQLELKDFENKALCNLIIYNVVLTNDKVQFEKTDNFVMHIDGMSFKDRNACVKAHQDLFQSSWNIPTVVFLWHDTSWESTPNWKQVISWYTCFCCLLSSWPHENENDLENIDWIKNLSDLD